MRLIRARRPVAWFNALADSGEGRAINGWHERAKLRIDLCGGTSCGRRDGGGRTRYEERCESNI